MNPAVFVDMGPCNLSFIRLDFSFTLVSQKKKYITLNESM